MRQMKVLTLLGGLAAVMFAAGAKAAPLQSEMESCRHSDDLSEKVAGCTAVIKASRDRRALLRAYNTRGLALCDLGRGAEAVDDFSRVIQIEPSIPGYFDNRARALRDAGRYSEALADSDRAIRMAPDYIREGRPSSTQERKKAQEFAFLFMGKAETLEAIPRLQEALSEIDKASLFDPSGVYILQGRAKVLGMLGRYEEAYAAYDRALALEPDAWGVYEERADTELAQGRPDAALLDLERYPPTGDDAPKVKERIAEIHRGQDADRRADRQRQQALAEATALQARQEADRQRLIEEERRLPQVVVNLVNPVAVGEKQTTPVNIANAANDHLSKDEVDRLNRSLGELESQVSALKGALDEQKRLKAASDGDVSTIDQTIALVSQQLQLRQFEFDRGQRQFSAYLTDIRPEDRQSYMTARAATQAFPRVPYYIPGTPETGEFWIEPTVSDTGVLAYQLRFVDPRADYNKVRETISMTPTELSETQAALTKVRAWSQKAHEAGLRKAYSKRAACFPQAGCPADGETIDGTASTEIRFNVYEDGSTAGRIQRNKGRFVEGYNLSTDSAMLLGAYIAYARRVAGHEFRQGTQTKQDLDKMFQ